MTASFTMTRPRAMRALRRVRKMSKMAKPVTTRAAGRLSTRPGSVKGGPLAQTGRRQTEAAQQILQVKGPARGHGGGAHAVFQDQVPADDPGGQFPKNPVGIGVGAAGLGHHGRQFGIAQGRQGAGGSRQEEGEEQARAGDLDAHPGDHEDAGADDLGHPDDHEVQAGEAAAAKPGPQPRGGRRGPAFSPAGAGLWVARRTAEGFSASEVHGLGVNLQLGGPRSGAADSPSR